MLLSIPVSANQIRGRRLLLESAMHIRVFFQIHLPYRTKKRHIDKSNRHFTLDKKRAIIYNRMRYVVIVLLIMTCLKNNQCNYHHYYFDVHLHEVTWLHIEVTW